MEISQMAIKVIGKTKGTSQASRQLHHLGRINIIRKNSILIQMRQNY